MDAKQFFRELPTKKLYEYERIYIKRLNEAKGNLPCHYPMPWMIPHWEEGLTLVREVFNEKKVEAMKLWDK